MGLFSRSNPKCPQCGRETVYTGYAAPYPSYRCNYCCWEAARRRDENDRIKELENRLQKLEKR